MKLIRWIILAGIVYFFTSCQARSTFITILDGNQILSLSSNKTIPAELLSEADVTLGSHDRLLYLGSSIPLDTALPAAEAHILTIRRAVPLTILAPDGRQTIETSAFTVGEALYEAGYTLYAADHLEPPADTPITGPLTLRFQPAREIIVEVDETHVKLRSAEATVGQALAEAGIPLIGLDTSFPLETAPLPDNGQIRVVRVVESVALTQKTIPFEVRTELSADLGLDQQEFLQGGEPGLAIARLRTRSEDGMQVSQLTESESVVRPPQDRILGVGTKIDIRTTTVDGVTIEYWRALNLFATYYTPCDLGPNTCYYGTASGKPVQKGVVAMVYPWYLLFAGESLYIPGYGYATVGDNNGANTNAYGDTYWIDLGYSETEPVDWNSHTVTVYFLTPVPANPGYILP